MGDEEAPVVDMANEMKIALWMARNSMEEFKGASAALATDDLEALDGVAQAYQEAVTNFDVFADAILEGTTLEDGTVVIRTDNDDLARLVRQSDDVHNSKFRTAAAEMMTVGRDLLRSKAKAQQAMEAMEEAYETVFNGADQLEVAIKKKMAAKRATLQSEKEISALLDQWCHMLTAQWKSRTPSRWPAFGWKRSPKRPKLR